MEYLFEFGTNLIQDLHAVFLELDMLHLVALDLFSQLTHCVVM